MKTDRRRAHNDDSVCACAVPEIRLPARTRRRYAVLVGLRFKCAQPWIDLSHNQSETRMHNARIERDERSEPNNTAETTYYASIRMKTDKELIAY